MILYHGSNIEISEIDLSKSKPFKDFGRAFYLSADRNQALEMAEYKAMVLGGRAVVTEFDFDEKVPDLKVLKFLEYTKEWAEFVFANRDKNSKIPHGYDIVYGPIANDKVGLQIVNYKEGIINLEVFLERLKFFKGVTFQYAFCTEKSLKTLRKI
ncbi:MAG: DUF3990 domain-containing protein [Bacteroidales bacterium]|nr:DUF3990 domain-containing protein [Bacteroidales bacterium]